jgi:hypothetical protein
MTFFLADLPLNTVAPNTIKIELVYYVKMIKKLDWLGKGSKYSQVWPIVLQLTVER